MDVVAEMRKEVRRTRSTNQEFFAEVPPDKIFKDRDFHVQPLDQKSWRLADRVISVRSKAVEPIGMVGSIIRVSFHGVDGVMSRSAKLIQVLWDEEFQYGSGNTDVTEVSPSHLINLTLGMENHEHNRYVGKKRYEPAKFTPQ